MNDYALKSEKKSIRHPLYACILFVCLSLVTVGCADIPGGLALIAAGGAAYVAYVDNYVGPKDKDDEEEEAWILDVTAAEENQATEIEDKDTLIGDTVLR